MYFNQEGFGNRLAKLCREKGVSQNTLALELNTTPAHISRIVHAKDGVSIDLVIDLAEYFDVSIDYLLTGREHLPAATRQALKNVMEEMARLIN